MQNQDKTTAIMNNELAKAYRACCNKGRAINKAGGMLDLVGIEVDRNAVAEASEPFFQAAYKFADMLKAQGLVERRYGEFVPKENA